MERTRIVHYTHARTPVVLSPTSPTTPRLSSSSSLSSLVSGTQDKAPLACIDTEYPSTPRRASKSGERTNARSSSTGRLLDDPKLETSIYTALRCQDYPSPATSVKRREGHENNSKERPHSTFTPVHTPDMDDANWRHTLGSWSRSRRKSQTESPNLALQRHNTTLSRTMSDATSPGTLVKSRRRYTWLSPKQTNSQVPTAAVAMRIQNTNNGDSLTPTSPEVIPDQPRTTNARPQTVTYDWKTDPRRKPCHFGDAFDLSPPHTPPHSPPQTPQQTPPQTPPKPAHGTRHPSDEEYTNQFAPSGNTPYAAISSSNAGKSSETCFYSRTLPMEKCNISSRDYPLPHLPNHPPPYNNIEHPTPYNAMDYTASSYCKDYPTSSYKGLGNLDTHIDTDHLDSQNGDMDHADLHSERLRDSTHDDKTPVDELSLRQCLSEFNDKQAFSSTLPVAYTHFSNTDSVRSVEDSNSLKERGYDMSPQKVNRHDCLVRSSFHGDFRTEIPQKKIDVNKSNSFHSDRMKNDLSMSSKHVPVLSGGAVKVSLDKRPALSNPRNKNSLRMALQDYDSWLDLTLETGSSTNLSEMFASVGGSQKNENVSREAIEKPKRNQISNEDNMFVSCKDLILSERAHMGNGAIRESDYPNMQSRSMCRLTVGGGDGVEDESESYKDDSLTRRIKRNSLRLATASLSDLTCAIDDIDINQEDSTTPDTEQTRVEEVEIPRHISLSPIKEKTNLSRTGSLLSSQHSSSFGSFYSCQSMDAISYKNSPSSNASHRNELRARFDSLMNSGFNRNIMEQSPWDASNPRVSITRTSSHSSTSSSHISKTSSGRSRPSHRQRPVYFWTRQSPYPRLLYTASSSATSSKSSDYRPPSPQPSPQTDNNSRHLNSDSAMSLPRSCHCDGKDSKAGLDKEIISRLQLPSGSSCRPIDRRSMTLPISAPHCPVPSHSHRLSEYYPPYTLDIPSLDVGDYSPDSNTVRSPPSLGRPRRKVYAGFDSQPLPMDSFMSDSSSVYTGVSCSSRATDMTGQPDGSQFDESFISEDIRSVYEEDSCGDISFDPSQTLLSSLNTEGSHHDGDENDSKHGSMQSTSTTKYGNGDSSVEEKSREGSSLHKVSDDDLIDNSNDNVSNKFYKQFGSEYDALFRLYKSDDVIGQRDMITSPSQPSHHFYLQNGKAFSSSCLLRSTLYSKRKFFSSRDIFDLFENSGKTSLDGTVSLTSLERHAHKVCEAILCCDEMDQGYIGKETHSLV